MAAAAAAAVAAALNKMLVRRLGGAAASWFVPSEVRWTALKRPTMSVAMALLPAASGKGGFMRKPRRLPAGGARHMDLGSMQLTLAPEKLWQLCQLR